METVRRFQDWAGPAVWVMMLLLAVYLCVKAGGFSFQHQIPDDVLLDKTKDAGVIGAAGLVRRHGRGGRDLGDLLRGAVPQLLRLLAGSPRTRTPCARATCGACRSTSSSSRWSPASPRSRRSTSTTRCCCTPSRSRPSSTAVYLALLAALTFAVATLGINVVANFVSPAFDFSNVFPSKISFKRGGSSRPSSRSSSTPSLRGRATWPGSSTRSAPRWVRCSASSSSTTT